MRRARFRQHLSAHYRPAADAFGLTLIAHYRPTSKTLPLKNATFEEGDAASSYWDCT